jgi:hypothetical protein
MRQEQIELNPFPQLGIGPVGVPGIKEQHYRLLLTNFVEIFEERLHASIDGDPLELGFGHAVGSDEGCGGGMTKVPPPFNLELLDASYDPRLRAA